MLKKIAIILIIMFFSSIYVYGEGISNVEIFNITEGKVIKVTDSKPKIQKIAIGYLHEISGVYGKFNPIPDKGYAIRIPLETSIKTESKWLNASVDEVIIIFPEGEPPFIILTDNENRLFCFSFKGDTKKLLKNLAFKINIP